MLWSIGTCQNEISADQYHVTISRAQVYSLSKARVFEVDRRPSAGFRLDRGLMSGKLVGRFVWKPVNANPGL